MVVLCKIGLLHECPMLACCDKTAKMSGVSLEINHDMGLSSRPIYTMNEVWGRGAIKETRTQLRLPKPKLQGLPHSRD